MSMKKKECRNFADPGLRFSPGSGLLLVESIEHIVRSAVKIIAGRRTLVLYFYNSRKAVEGCFTPEYTLFQGKDDYITLQRIGGGLEKWREASLDNLGEQYAYFTNKCAFYRQRDEQTVTRFCNIPDNSGFDALNALQAAIMCVRLEKRIKEREHNIIERMKPIPAIPRGLKGWIHREVLPHYIFYDYKRGGKQMKGYCTACRHDVMVSGAKYNGTGTCPHCNKKITFKSSGKAKRVYDGVTVQVLQKVNDGELVLRIFKIYNALRDWRRPHYTQYENARMFIGYNEAKDIKIEAYYFDYSKGTYTHWVKGMRPRFSHYQYSFACDMRGHLYCGNLANSLESTPWQYSQLGLFQQIESDAMEVLPYLRAYLKYPAIEYLVKLGLTNIAGSIVYTYDGEKLINASGKNFKEVLGVDAADLSILQKINATMSQLALYRHLAELCVRADENLLTWYLERKIFSCEDVSVPLRYTTPLKFMRYTDEQYERLKEWKTHYGGQRYDRPGRVLSEYKDYLEMGDKLEYDFSDSFVLFPKNLPEAHDQASILFDAKKQAVFDKAIREAYKALREQYFFSKGGYAIMPPKTAREIVTEGHTLHHCVHSYVERVAKGRCVVLFVRQKNNIKEPFYTVEVQDGKVIQIHGTRHSAPTPEVKAFLDLWERKKLTASSVSKAA